MSQKYPIIIDDPHSGEVVVTSEARKRALDWFTEVIANRAHGEMLPLPSHKSLWPETFTPEQVKKIKEQYKESSNGD